MTVITKEMMREHKIWKSFKRDRMSAGYCRSCPEIGPRYKGCYDCFHIYPMTREATLARRRILQGGQLMTDNERINEWWMKLRGFKKGPAPKHWSCGCETAWLKEGDASCPQCMSIDFDSPHSDAWTPELFKAIEDAGLHHKFAVKVNGNLSVWEAIKATPSQLARALAATIDEIGG